MSPTFAELRQAFRAGHDIHALTASEVFGVPIDGDGPADPPPRQGDQFRHHLRHQRLWPGQQIGVPQAEAADYIKAYFARFPASAPIWSGPRATAAARLCRDALRPALLYPRHQRRQPARRAGAERQAINAPLQGAAADIIKRAMARIPPALAKAGLTARMLLQVHDELVFEAPESRGRATAALVKRVMEGACAPRRELSVPLVVETGMAQNWDEAH